MRVPTDQHPHQYLVLSDFPLPLLHPPPLPLPLSHQTSKQIKTKNREKNKQKTVVPPKANIRGPYLCGSVSELSIIFPLYYLLLHQLF